MVETLLYTSTMSMNIKDEEVHRLARKLADQTGHSMTQVVREALTEYDTKLKALDKKQQLREALSALIGCLAEEDFSRQQADDFLYDPQTGLPH
jgi:antitoxin VapB